MLKLRALNKESSSDEDGPMIRREAQEEITLDMYNKALRLQSCGELIAAEDILQTLIEENIPQLECQGGLPKTMSTIKYSCYVNLGSVALKKNNLPMALENYLNASELDKSDVTLWYKIGTLALKLDKFHQALFAFVKGLECSESHWPCLDQIISVSFAVKDTITCLQYIGKALILDSDYIKGLVLRKNIYDCNPAAKEYYQLYNPDYIYEPSLDIPINKEDEIKYLEEAQKLCDRVNEVERALGPKPLLCIPLPKPLKDYTWLALGHTLTHLHKYLSENKMSHFTMVDLKKCMSNEEKENSSSAEKTVTKPFEKLSDVISKVLDKREESKSSLLESELVQKISTEEIVEWRIAQPVEHNVNEGDNSPPIQTDCEEIEQDVEDIDENLDQKVEKNKQANRGTKRRRDLLSDLQIWGWHSKRKAARKAKIERDFTIEDALMRIIPAYLRPNGISCTKYNPSDDSMNTMELYNMHVENEANSLMTPPHSPKYNEKENYFGSQEEKENVLKFWNREWACCDAVNLIEAYVYSLAALWSYKWPKELVHIYIEAYGMFREHFEHPQFHDKSRTFEEFKNDALATLLYGELTSYNKEIREQTENKIHDTSLWFLQYVSAWDQNWADEHAHFWSRVNWLRAYVFRKNNQNLLAINALHLMQDVIIPREQELNELFKLQLPNCNKYGIILTQIIEKLLKNLQTIESLAHVEELYNAQKYKEAIDVLIPTFNMLHPPTYGKMGRPAQLAMLLHCLWYTDIEECFVWTEICLHESVGHFIKPRKDKIKWEMMLDKCLCIIYEIIKKETVTILDTLAEDKRVRLVESLAKICCRQINTENVTELPLGTIKPWILLYYALLREEHRKQAKKVVKHVKKDEEKKLDDVKTIEEETAEEDIPPSIAVLFSGHEFLGGKGWCLIEQGELLHFILDTIIDRLDTPIFEPLRDKIEVHLEQAFFCLYQHPSKKNKISRHLADHNVNPLPLTWEKAQQVCEFFCPDALPEFDSYKNISISAELEQLLQRITSLVPPECDVQPLLPKVTDFVNGNADVLPEPIHFPIKTRAMYYLLGDYYFKQSEVKRSYKYFLLDLCINPSRLDTWACLALGTASQLESKLNHCERFKNEIEFLDRAKSAQVCFKQALGLANNHITLWIEYGSFEYMVHSYCSRVLKYESETLSMEKFDILENKKENYLNSSEVSFMKALELHQPDQCEIDERWLYHYMLGKIAEKRQKEPTEYLQHYLSAAALLNENKATYPDKISYMNPQHLALEALEVLYRINASILKYLELHEGKMIPDNIGKMFKQCLESCTFPKHGCENRPQTKVADDGDVAMETDKPNNEPQAEVTENVYSYEIVHDVSKCVEDMVDKVVEENKKATEDVIMIDDSDDDVKKVDEYNKKPGDIRVRNVQEIMDAMMKETMDKQEDTPMDTDSDIAPQEVLVSPEEAIQNKNLKAEVKDEREVKDETEAKDIRKSVDDASTTSSSSSDSDSSDSDSDDSSSVTSSSSSDNSGNLTETEVLSMVERCITGLEQCIRRLPQNYKALYRLAHLYYHYSKKKDSAKCRQLFLGEYKCKNSVLVTGLFADRKTSNFFNGVWRIPSSEIDRPGSLAAHMGRCVSLLLQVLHDTNDHKTLLDLCLQLRRIPDADKIYIRHIEREQLSEQALTLCIQCLRKQIKNMTNLSSVASQKFLLDVFRMYQRSQKNLTHKESVFSSMLTEVYKNYMGDKVPENANLLDLAVKYCQQNRAAEKLKKQQQTLQNLLPRSSAATPMPPVLPPPSSIAATANQPLKRPGLGRPRGRPPGPKIAAGQVRAPRGRSPITNSNLLWNKSSYEAATYDYLKHYQEELLRQYSQTLTLTQQMNHLSQYLPTSSQISTNLLQSMQQLGTGINPLIGNQLSQSLNQLNPNLMKKLNDMYKVPTSTLTQGMTAEQINRQYAALAQQSTSNKNLLTAQMNNLLATQTKMPSNIPVFSSSSSSTFKYPPAEFSKPKPKENTKTTSSYVANNNEHASLKSIRIKSNQQESEKAASILKDRPNISITPVTQLLTTNKSPPKPVTSQAKTLQEKLADKQKQHCNKNLPSSADFSSKVSAASYYAALASSKALDFGPKEKSSYSTAISSSSSSSKPLDYGTKNVGKIGVKLPEISVYPGVSSSSTFSTTTNLSNINIPSSLNVIPTFPKETEVIINQIGSGKSSKTGDQFFSSHKSDSASNNKPKSSITVPAGLDLPPNIPMSLSVIRKPEEKPERKLSADDDVIIIE